MTTLLNEPFFSQSQVRDSALADFPSLAEVETSILPVLHPFVRTAGYASPGDGGGAFYRRVTPYFDVSALNADLAHSHGTLAIVIGVGEGAYVKIGGLETGSWSLVPHLGFTARPSNCGWIRTPGGSYWENDSPYFTPMQFGAKGDAIIENGVVDERNAWLTGTNDTTALVRAIAFAMWKRRWLKLGGRNYYMDHSLSPLRPDTGCLPMIDLEGGCIVRPNNSLSVDDEFNFGNLYFLGANGCDIELVTIVNGILDGNRRGNPIAQQKEDEGKPYFFRPTSQLRVLANNNVKGPGGRIRKVAFDLLRTVDSVGESIAVGPSSTAEHIRVDEFHATRVTLGRRNAKGSDIAVGSCVRTVVGDAILGPEPEDENSDPGQDYTAYETEYSQKGDWLVEHYLSNSRVGRFQVNAQVRMENKRCVAYLHNVNVTKDSNIGAFTVYTTGKTTLRPAAAPKGRSWGHARLFMDGGTIFIPHDNGYGLYGVVFLRQPFKGALNNEIAVELDGTELLIDTQETGELRFPTSKFLLTLSPMSTAAGEKIYARLRNIKVDPRAHSVLDCDGFPDTEIDGGEYFAAANGVAFQVGGFSAAQGYPSVFRISRAPRIGGAGKHFRTVGVGEESTYDLSGDWGLQDPGSISASSIAQLQQSNVYSSRHFLVMAKPTGGGFKGDRARLVSPSYPGINEWICTRSHPTAATWQDLGASE